MGDDFLSTVTGGAMTGAQPAPAAPSSVDPDTDAAVRTAYAAAKDADGWKAAANVIRNRSTASGKGYAAVVNEPNAFSEISSDKYKNLKAGSPQYQTVLSAITPVLQGNESPVGDADSYYSPSGMKGKGAPGWATGTPVGTVSGNVFYSGKYKPQGPDSLSVFTGGAMSGSPAPSSPAYQPHPEATVQQSGPLPAVVAQPLKLSDSAAFMGYHSNGEPAWAQDAIDWHRKTGVNNPDLPSYDVNLPAAPKGYYWPQGTEMGADGKPHYMMAANDPNRVEQFDPKLNNEQMTAWRLGLTPSGQAAMAQARSENTQALSGNTEIPNAVLNGVTQGTLPWLTGEAGYGVQAITNGINRLTGQPITISAADRRDAEQLADSQLLGYSSAQHPLLTAGGSLLTAIPAIESGVGVIRALPAAADALGASEPVVNALTQGSRFATGQSLADQSGLFPVAVRAASQGTSGALQGALGGAVTTGLTDRGIGDNMASGALFGGALGAGGSALLDTANGAKNALLSAARPFSQEGRDRIVGNLLNQHNQGVGIPSVLPTSEIPGVNYTLAQSLNSPGVANLETAYQSLEPGATNLFGARASANNAARQAYTEALTGGKSDIDALVAARDADAGETLRSAFANSQPANSSPVLSAIDEQLAGPEGQVGEARSALTAARKRLVGTTEGLTPQQNQGFQQSMLQSIGADEPTLDNVTMANAKERIGKGLDDIASRTHVNLTDDVMSRFGQVAKDWTDAGYEEKPINALIEKIGNVRNEDGSINGDAYQTLTRKGGPFDKLANLGAGYKQASADLRDVLDQALEDSTSPQDLAEVRNLRSQYRNMKMIEGAMLKSPTGDAVTPQSLLSSIKSNTSNYVYKGGNDLGDAATLAYRQGLPRETLETDPAKLFGIRTDLDKVARAGGPGSAPAAAVRDQIDRQLQTAAPGYGDFLTKDAQYEQQIGEKRYLQGQRFDNGKGDITEAKVRNIVQGINRGQIQPGQQAASMISPETTSRLDNLLTDLGREESSRPSGRLGSNTVNKLATQNFLQRVGIPIGAAAEFIGNHLHIPIPGAGLAIGSAAGAGARALYAGKDALLQEQLQNALLNPQYGVSLMQRAAAPNAADILASPALRYQIPTVAGGAAAARNLLLSAPQGSGN